MYCTTHPENNKYIFEKKVEKISPIRYNILIRFYCMHLRSQTSTMKQSITLLHCADIHLDPVFAACTPEQASARRDELRSAFCALLEYAKSSRTDLILIAGDLFEQEFVTPALMELLCREFAAIPDCRIFISPGNHDPLSASSAYAKTEFPPNVFLFRSAQASCFDLDDLRVHVYGYAFLDHELTADPLEGLTLTHPGELNLLCAHGDLNAPASKKCPISSARLAQIGFDYAALGHIHNAGGIRRLGNTYYGYSGCLEGRNFGECGVKGAYAVTLTKEDGQLSADIRKLRFSRRRYEIAPLDLTGVTEASDAYARILEAAAPFDPDTTLRLALHGETGASLLLSESYIRTQLEGRLAALEIVNDTLPTFDEDALEKDPTLRGEFFRLLLPELRSEDPQTRQTAALALRLGLSALNGA